AAALAKADPDEARAFERPCPRGAALVERERNHEREEHGRDRKRRLEGDAELRTSPHPRREDDVERGERERRQRSAVLGVADETVLERKDDRRQPEQQAAVDPRVALSRRRAIVCRLPREAARRQHEDDDEEEEERDQERLARRVIVGSVLEHAPRRR